MQIEIGKKYSVAYNDLKIEIKAKDVRCSHLT